MDILMTNMMNFYRERHDILLKQMCIIRNTLSLDTAVNAANEAFRQMDEHYEPFSPDDAVAVAEEVRVAS